MPAILLGPAAKSVDAPEAAILVVRPLLRRFELVLVMDALQERRLGMLAPWARPRIQRLGGYGGFDVPDPFGEPRKAFERALALIERGLEDYDREPWTKA